MSTQKLKKGFTLIELMVVIVIIGILAAIAIPKLFGMSAKAKAQEVGPAFGTWVKMQQAYKMETGHWGGNKKISYKMPGDKPNEKESETSNFKYKTNVEVDAEGDDILPDLEATARFTSDNCKSDAGKWEGKFAAKTDEVPKMKISDPDCKALTPNFLAIGDTTQAQQGP